jgi:hypothetical protein
MLPLHVGWYLPLSTPSNNIVLPYPKTHKIPYPKTHNPHATIPKNSQKNTQLTKKLC